MRILLIGNVNSPFIFDYAKNLKKANPNIKIDAFCTLPFNKKKDASSFFNRIINPFSKCEKVYKLKIIGTILKMLVLKFFLLRQKKYDVIHVHFICYLTLYNTNLLKRKSNKLITTIYGSDFYQIKPFFESRLLKTLNKADKITCTNTKTSNKILSKYPDFNKNIEVIRFGLTPLDVIDELRDNFNRYNFLNLDAKYFVITCGYHGNAIMNHLKIINAINEIKNLLPNNYILVFQFGYGGKSSYREEVESLLIEYSLNYVFIDSYISNEEIAFLRLRTDISIQAPKTDQFSGSIQEYIYAKTIVITGDWLPYDLLYENGIELQKISSFKELPNKIIYCIKKHQQLNLEATNNFEKIAELSSWGVNIPKWYNLYKQ